MKKKIYLTIIYTVTILCVVFGTLFHTGILGRKSGVVVNELKNTGRNVPAEETYMDSGGTERDYNKDGGSFLINANIAYGNLEIVYGESFRSVFTGDDELEPKVTFEDGVITISQKPGNWSIVFGSRKADLTLIIPENTVLKNTDIKMDMGNVSITGLSISAGQIENSLGDIELNDCILGTVNVSSDMGDVDIESCVFENLSIEQSLGNVTVYAKQDMSDADIELGTDLGQVKINGSKQGKTFSQKGDRAKRLYVHNDLGDIELNYR